PVFDSMLEPGNDYLTVGQSGWAWLEDGSIAALGQLVSLSVQSEEARLVTVAPDGTISVGLPPFSWMPQTGNLRLAPVGTDRPVLLDWEQSYNGHQAAFLRYRWASRQFISEPGFEQ